MFNDPPTQRLLQLLGVRHKVSIHILKTTITYKNNYKVIKHSVKSCEK